MIRKLLLRSLNHQTQQIVKNHQVDKKYKLNYIFLFKFSFFSEFNESPSYEKSKKLAAEGAYLSKVEKEIRQSPQFKLEEEEQKENHKLPNLHIENKQLGNIESPPLNKENDKILEELKDGEPYQDKNTGLSISLNVTILF